MIIRPGEPRAYAAVDMRTIVYCRICGAVIQYNCKPEHTELHKRIDKLEEMIQRYANPALVEPPF